MIRWPDPMHWLVERVPLTLLVDLAETNGPDSTEISRVEGGDAGWLPRPVTVA